MASLNGSVLNGSVLNGIGLNVVVLSGVGSRAAVRPRRGPAQSAETQTPSERSCFQGCQPPLSRVLQAVRQPQFFPFRLREALLRHQQVTPAQQLAEQFSRHRAVQRDRHPVLFVQVIPRRDALRVRLPQFLSALGVHFQAQAQRVLGDVGQGVHAGLGEVADLEDQRFVVEREGFERMRQLVAHAAQVVYGLHGRLHEAEDSPAAPVWALSCWGLSLRRP